MALQEGKPAPDFKLPSTGGKDLKLSDFKDKSSVVLYFYPKDHTPGCTQEACDFRDGFKKLEKAGAVVLGVSADSLESHAKFREKWGLPFALLSDEKREVVKKYGVWQEKSLYGRKFMGIVRTTVVIDKQGMVRRIFSKVKVDRHLEEVLEVLKGL